MIEVLITDDQTLVRAGLRALVENAEDLTVLGEADTGRRALEVARGRRPDVILMDLQMPVMDGVAATRAIREDPLLHDVPVLVLTTFHDDSDVLRAIRAGASGYLLKDIDAEELRRAIRNAAAGLNPVAPAVAGRMMEQIARTPARDEQRHLVDGLSPREVEVLTHVGQGMSNHEIGAALYLSPETARTYVSRLMTKLDARDRAQLVVLAHRAGLAD
jgi:DNA-binding NarL/FixJ family response regulator